MSLKHLFIGIINFDLLDFFVRKRTHVRRNKSDSTVRELIRKELPNVLSCSALQHQLRCS